MEKEYIETLLTSLRNYKQLQFIEKRDYYEYTRYLKSKDTNAIEKVSIVLASIQRYSEQKNKRHKDPEYDLVPNKIFKTVKDSDVKSESFKIKTSSVDYSSSYSEDDNNSSNKEDYSQEQEEALVLGEQSLNFFS